MRMDPTRAPDSEGEHAYSALRTLTDPLLATFFRENVARLEVDKVRLPAGRGGRHASQLCMPHTTCASLMCCAAHWQRAATLGVSRLACISCARVNPQW